MKRGGACDEPSARDLAFYEDWIPRVYRPTDALLGEMRQVNQFTDLTKFPRALAHLPTPPESMKRLLLTDPQAVYLGGGEWT